jgi:hypothetical protein
MNIIKNYFFIIFFIISLAYSQTKSAIQFWDSTGTNKTGKIGWSGDAQNGYFFVNTPQKGDLIKSTSDGIEINGTVKGNKFLGDGSGLTNLPASNVTVQSVTGLVDSLSKKASIGSLNILQNQIGAKADTTWVNSKLLIKADTTYVNLKVSSKADTLAVNTLTTNMQIKADTSWVNTKLQIKADTGWVSSQLSIKADTTWVKNAISASGTGEIPDGGITTSKIADNAVTNNKLGSLGTQNTIPMFGANGLTDSYITQTSNGLSVINSDIYFQLKATSSEKSAYVYCQNDNNRYIQLRQMGTTHPGTYAGLNFADLSYIIANNTNALLIAHAIDKPIVFSTNELERMRIASGGNIGIGTSTPTAKLTVKSGGQIFNFGVGSNSSGYSFDFGANDDGANITNNSTLRGFNFKNENGLLFSILYNGDVQIPKFKSKGILHNDSTGLLSSSLINNSDLGNLGTQNTIPMFGANGLTDSYITQTSNGLSVINSDIYFQLKATSSEKSAYVYCQNDNNRYIQLRQMGTTHPGTYAGLNFADLGYIFANNTNALLIAHAIDKPIVFSTNELERMRIASGGNIGIGTTTPEYTLDVNGIIRGSNVTVPSDIRYKTNITPIDSALLKVSKLKGVYFDFNRSAYPKKNFPEGKQIGLIAQDVEKVLPEVVNTDKEGYKSISYDKITALLIEAIKEQQEEISQLKKEIAVLKANMSK